MKLHLVCLNPMAAAQFGVIGIEIQRRFKTLPLLLKIWTSSFCSEESGRIPFQSGRQGKKMLQEIGKFYCNLNQFMGLFFDSKPKNKILF
ncbi:MAG: hypothetical protein JNJ57_04730 [Saprospiraceae bacterium]|nr:hypothetical protein [Saprospiraceae bacterium]